MPSFSQSPAVPMMKLGQTITVNGIIYIYDATDDSWTKIGSTLSSSGGAVFVSPSPPPLINAPERVNIWINANNGKQYLYVNDLSLLTPSH